LQMDWIMLPTSHRNTGQLTPALVDVPGARTYLGGPSRAKFYADLLPQLDVVKFGVRTFVTVESLDRLIAKNTRRALEQPSGSGTETNTPQQVGPSERAAFRARPISPICGPYP
jgi:hypothetical protein